MATWINFDVNKYTNMIAIIVNIAFAIVDVVTIIANKGYDYRSFLQQARRLARPGPQQQ